MIMIGQIREVYEDDKYPSIKELINRPIKNKEKVIEYMKKSKVIAQAPAVGRDLINSNNTTLELSLMTDGDYEWRSDIIYYVEKYDMELPEEFIKHVLSQN
ncbi:hypothetical protein [Clostridium sp. 'White wine YQ']|uniref:hypothetical protein n=1 Tax=Clostridium sp. 'White wine YQ' TaxID=3027474 RepID=UPI0023670832|nr:hypothetical protein [Clostridium sp. 'White wine YQ']MDD7793338.1 hypothetical protein [Clostridium sp. 'White wine YQ']